MIEYILGVSAFLCVIRAILGPSIFDRIISIDALCFVTIGFLVFLSKDNVFYLDVAIVFAVLNFISTLALAKYLSGEKFD